MKTIYLSALLLIIGLLVYTLYCVTAPKYILFAEYSLSNPNQRLVETITVNSLKVCHDIKTSLNTVVKLDSTVYYSKIVCINTNTGVSE